MVVQYYPTNITALRNGAKNVELYEHPVLVVLGDLAANLSGRSFMANFVFE